MATSQECVCGYLRRDKANWYHHRKSCKVLRVAEPLQQELERLRAQQQDAAERADQQRDAALNELQTKYLLLAEKVERLEAQQQALVPAKSTTIHNNTITNKITINIYTYEETPLPTRKEVLALLNTPSHSLPNYFQRKHLSDPKTRNIKLVGDDKVAIYSRDRESGVSKWKTRERKPTLTRIVGRLIDDLTERYEAPRDKDWTVWKAHCSRTGLNWLQREEMDAFKEAERQIEDRLMAEEAA